MKQSNMSMSVARIGGIMGAAPEENLDMLIQSNRSDGLSKDGFNREEMRQSLLSQNPLRENIPYSEEALFFLEIVEKYGLNNGNVRIYNETMESIAQFFEKAIKNKKMKGFDPNGIGVEIHVKYIADGKPEYSLVSNHMPHEFLKNKSISQTLVFRYRISSTDIVDIIPTPFMVGCKWCKTHGMTPIELHKHGENAVNYRGYFIIDGTPRYFLAHEKIAHNVINVVPGKTEGTFITTLKIKDELNNSVENILSKGGESSSGAAKAGDEDIYYLKTACLNAPIEANKIFKQIFIFISKLENHNIYSSYNDFINHLIHIISGANLRHYVIYNAEAGEGTEIKIPDNMDYVVALEKLYKNKDRMEIYRSIYPHLNDRPHYAEMVISSIFPSIGSEHFLRTQTQETGNTRNANHRRYGKRDEQYEAEKKRRENEEMKYEILFSKALLLMRMIVLNILTEHGVHKPTNRNHVGNKAYMTAPEIMRRDLTRDQGQGLDSYKGNYRPKASVAKGESDVFEVLEFTNHFNVISSETSLSIPRCSHSKDPEIRGVNAYHTGNVCPSESPSNDQVGLSTKQALTACFSVEKSVNMVKNVVARLISHIRFPLDTQGKKMFSINSVPYAMITHQEFEKIRNTFKRDYRLMDVAIIEESYKVYDYDTRKACRYISSYNLICDGGRIYRPLFNVDILRQKGLVNDIAISTYLKGKSFEDVLKDGVIEMCFPSEMEFYKIADTRKKLIPRDIPAFFPYPEAVLSMPPFLLDFLLARDKAKNEEIPATSSPISAVSPEGALSTLRAMSSAVPPNVVQNRGVLMPAGEASRRGIIEGVIDYKFCEIDPVAVYGYVCSCATMINHIPGNRAMHEPAMAKSAITPITTNANYYTDSSAKILHSTTAAAVTTKTNELSSRYVNNGISSILAINVTETNIEDAYTVNERWADRILNERIITIEISISEDEKMGIAPGTVYRRDRYHHIDEITGLPEIGVLRNVGDVILAKYKKEKPTSVDRNNSGAGEDGEMEECYRNESIQIETGKDGYVHDIKEMTIEKTRVYRIVIVSYRTVDKGNKLATRYSQKGVVGGVIKHRNIPFVHSGKSKGLRPDLIYSPLSLTSRATPALIIELLLGTYAVVTGKQVDATPFTITLERVVQYNKELVDLGYAPWGMEEYTNPLTGNRFQMMTGIAYVRALKHTAFEKQKAAGLVNFSSVDKLTGQPSKGGPTGPVKAGYMDAFTQAAHSIPHFMNAVFSTQSDRIFAEFCSNCGHLCDRCNRDPSSVRDVQASRYCTKCNQPSIITTSIPKAMIIYHHQLIAMGIKMSMFPKEENE
jgi:DNA-directed RNA polymerase beta subunit